MTIYRQREGGGRGEREVGRGSGREGERGGETTENRLRPREKLTV